MEYTSQGHETQAGAQAEMRAVPGFDQETGRLAGVTLTRRAPREGASIGVHTERPDLDAAVPPLRGWHWFADRGDIVCELAPTIPAANAPRFGEDVLEQVAEDILRESLADYWLHGHDPAEQLREAATLRMSLPPDEAEFQCARLLREYQAHLRRGANPSGFTGIEADDED